MRRPKLAIIALVLSGIVVYGAMFYRPPDVAKSATVDKESLTTDPNIITFSQQIQAELVRQGYDIEVDGKIGPETRAAIKLYDERLMCDWYARKEFE